MTDEKKIPIVDAEIKAKASSELDEEVAKELNIPDPEQSKGLSLFNENQD